MFHMSRINSAGSSISTTTVPNRAFGVSFEAIKREFPVREVIARELGTSSKKMFRCPFHNDTTASLSVTDSRGLFKCHAGSCGVGGSVLDFVWLRRPELRNRAGDTLQYLNALTGRSVEATASVSTLSLHRPTDPQPEDREDFECGGTVLDYAQLKTKTVAEVSGRHRTLRRGAAYDECREYARARGWLPDAIEVAGATPYPVGCDRWDKGFLARHASLSFPKLIQTRRTAYLFGLEERFEREGRAVCVGSKLRLTPRVHRELWDLRMKYHPEQTREELEPSRWWNTPGFSCVTPWEMDANEDAETLVICEGPGDGVRLYHEAHASPGASAIAGHRWHITACDNAGIWTESSLERRALKLADGQEHPVSFFDGFRLIVLLFDRGEGGRRAAERVRALARRQAPHTPLRDVVLPGIAGNRDTDLCDYFDAGACVFDLLEEIKGTPFQ